MLNLFDEKGSRRVAGAYGVDAGDLGPKKWGVWYNWRNVESGPSPGTGDPFVG